MYYGMAIGYFILNNQNYNEQIFKAINSVYWHADRNCCPGKYQELC
jgi:hypothetical protein